MASIVVTRATNLPQPTDVSMNTMSVETTQDQVTDPNPPATDATVNTPTKAKTSKQPDTPGPVTHQSKATDKPIEHPTTVPVDPETTGAPTDDVNPPEPDEETSITPTTPSKPRNSAKNPKTVAMLTIILFYTL